MTCAIGYSCDEGTDTCVVTECIVDAECADGLDCNGVETCTGGLCTDGADLCTNGYLCDEQTNTCSPGGFGDLGQIVDAGSEIHIDWPVANGLLYGLVSGTVDVSTLTSARVWIFIDQLGVGNSTPFSPTTINALPILGEAQAPMFNLFICPAGGASVCAEAQRLWINIDAPWTLTGLVHYHCGANRWFDRVRVSDYTCP